MDPIINSEDDESQSWVKDSRDGYCTSTNSSSSSDMRQKRQPVASAKWNKKAAMKKKPRMALHDVVSHSNVMDVEASSAETFLRGSGPGPFDYSALSSVISSPPPPSAAKSATSTKDSKIRQGRKTSYRHIPHSEKPPHLVAKRNERERKRVQAVNSAFLRLRKYVPHEPRNKRLSKFKTLKFAIQYIQHMQDMIQSHDRQVASKRNTFLSSRQNITRSNNSFNCFTSLSTDQRNPTFKNGTVLQDLPYSNLTSVDHSNDNNERQDRALRRINRFSSSNNIHNNNNNNNNNKINVPCMNFNVENRSNCDVNNSYQRSEYNRYARFEQDYCSQRYHLEYHRFYQDFPYQIQNQPYPYQQCPSPEFEDYYSGASPDLQNCTYGLDSVRTLGSCRISDCSSSFHQAPSTSSGIDSWEDCGSDISCSASTESASPIDSIPSFHQVISFLDEGNYKDGHTNNINSRDCEYAARLESVYVGDGGGFPGMNCSSFASGYPEGCSVSK